MLVAGCAWHHVAWAQQADEASQVPSASSAPSGTVLQPEDPQVEDPLNIDPLAPLDQLPGMEVEWPEGGDIPAWPGEFAAEDVLPAETQAADASDSSTGDVVATDADDVRDGLATAAPPAETDDGALAEDARAIAPPAAPNGRPNARRIGPNARRCAKSTMATCAIASPSTSCRPKI